MRKGFGFLLVLLSFVILGGVAAIYFKADYFLLSPKEKFIESFQNDIALLKKSGTLPEAYSHIREVEIKSDNSPARDWLDDLKRKIPRDQNGTYKLSVMVIHWIEANRYGAIVQYNLVDLKSGNTVWEFSRTFKLGYLL